jgi:hypothetical protein
MEETLDAGEIQQRMKMIRGEMGHDMRTLVTNARTLSDWRYYWNKYPWALCGAAAVIGYVLVPPRHAIATTTVVHAPAEGGKQQKRTLKAMILGAITSAAMNGLSAYASKVTNEFIKTGKLDIPGLTGFGGFGQQHDRPGSEVQRHEEPHY